MARPLYFQKRTHAPRQTGYGGSTLHSITSSAMASSLGGTSRLSAFAVLTLITSDGGRAKLAINLILGLNRLALAEGLVFAQRLGSLRQGEGDLDNSAVIEEIRRRTQS